MDKPEQQTDVQYVLERVEGVRLVGVPVKGSHGSCIAHYEVLVGLNIHPPCIGIGTTPEEAWADAAKGLRDDR